MPHLWAEKWFPKTVRNGDLPSTVSNSFRERYFVHNYTAEERLFFSIHSTVYTLEILCNLKLLQLKQNSPS